MAGYSMVKLNNIELRINEFSRAEMLNSKEGEVVKPRCIITRKRTTDNTLKQMWESGELVSVEFYANENDESPTDVAETIPDDWGLFIYPPGWVLQERLTLDVLR